MSLKPIGTRKPGVPSSRQMYRHLKLRSMEIQQIVDDREVVRFLFNDATIHVVSAGDCGVRYQVRCIQGGTVRNLSSHLHITENSAWKAAATEVKALYGI